MTNNSFENKMTEEKGEQRFVCVWLDNQLIRSDEYIETQTELQATIQVFKSFTKSDQCVDFITDLTNVRVFFITTNVLAKLLIPLIHSIEQIYGFYIFYTNKSSLDEQWMKQFPKIKGVFRDVKLICDRFIRDTVQQENEQISVSILSSNDINRQDPSFMYFQLIKEILLNDCLLESEEQTKIEMIDYCRKVCVDNPTAIVLLDEFEQTFIPEMSIYWYTRESFLYKMLNKALWTPEPDVLYKLRYFLRHLSRQILSEAEKQRDQLSSMVVYRGQSMSMNQIEKLKRNLGGFLSFNNFLSTSLKRLVALDFLMGSETGVLFEIEIDLRKQKFPVVNIELIDYLKTESNEQELLFAMGSVFRILSVEKHSNFYIVQLVLSEDIDENLEEYKKQKREKIRSFHSFTSLLRLMDEFEQYSYVDQFVEFLNEDSTLNANPLLIGSIHHQLGSIYSDKKQSEKALEHYHKSLEISLNSVSSDHSSLSPTYNNIACVYLSDSNYEQAFHYQKLALDNALKSEDQNVSSIVLYTKNLGNICENQRNYQQAIEYFQKALQLQKEYLGENDPSLTETYNRISSIYHKIEDYGQAVVYHEKAAMLEETTCQLDPTIAAENSIRNGKLCSSQQQYKEALIHFNSALEIQQTHLLPNNPTLSKTYDYLADSYFNLKLFQQSLDFYKKVFEIEENLYSNDHSRLATSLFNISRTYLALEDYSQALEFALKSVEKLKQSKDSDLKVLAAYIHHLGFVFYSKQDYENALKFYQEANQIYDNLFMDYDPSLITIRFRTANALRKSKKYSQALDLYQKILKIELIIFSNDQKTIADIYLAISKTYLGLQQIHQAIINGQLALQQLKKTLLPFHPEVIQCQLFLDNITKQHF